jgi:hypothetical protein
MNSNSTSLVPLSLAKSVLDDIPAKVSINPVKMPLGKSMAIATPTNGNGSTLMSFKAGEIPASCQTMPLNLHAATAAQQLPNGYKNGLKGYNR